MEDVCLLDLEGLFDLGCFYCRSGLLRLDVEDIPEPHAIYISQRYRYGRIEKMCLQEYIISVLWDRWGDQERGTFTHIYIHTPPKINRTTPPWWPALKINTSSQNSPFWKNITSSIIFQGRAVSFSRGKLYTIYIYRDHLRAKFPCLVKAVSSLDMGSMWWIAWRPQFLRADENGWVGFCRFFWGVSVSMKMYETSLSFFSDRCSFCIVALCKKMVKIPKIHQFTSVNYIIF